MMTQEGADIALKIILSVLGFACLTIFKRISDDIKGLSQSVQSLNISMAVVLEKIVDHGERIKRLEER